MSGIVLIVSVIVVFIIAYITYGSYLAKSWGIDPKKETPAHYLEDGMDYVPAKAPVVLGHHFSSIAGAGPIVGPIAGAIFGWLPVFLWIVIGSIFFGGVHDMGALFMSVRNDGKSIGEVINSIMGKKGKLLFSIFAWLALVLVVAAFTNIVANTFVASPAAATSSLLFIALAIVFGIGVYRMGAPISIASVIGVIALFACVWVGQVFPLALSKNTWMIILLGYIYVASVTPVWILLQPRDYLSSFLLYAMLLGGVAGLIVYNPVMAIPATTGFNVGGKMLFPILFVTLACGAISGFHSLVGSGTTSKQIDNEKDVRMIGYGAMLIEGVLAVIALITVGYISFEQSAGLGGAIGVFSNGLGTFMSTIGIPFEIGKNFTSLAISAFALTSLDTATRLARFIFQEIFEKEDSQGEKVKTPLTNIYVSTAVTVGISAILVLYGYQKIWPIFGASNQLLAALSLTTLALWLKSKNKSYKNILFPVVFMFAVTIVALVQLVSMNLENYLLLAITVMLLILAIVLIKMSIDCFFKKETLDDNSEKPSIE